MNKNIFSRRAKIICTLGPSTSSPEQIRELAGAGMDIARLNFSHGTHDEHKRMMETVRNISMEIGRPLAVLQDLQGPKIRVQTFQNGEINLAEGDKITLTLRKNIENEREISVSCGTFNRDVRVGNTVLLDDGNIKLEVEDVNETGVRCRVIFGGILGNHKGLNLPGSVLPIDALTEKDKKDLKFGLEMGVDFIALSFVQKCEDVQVIKEAIEAFGKNTPVVAKIEKPQAVKDIEAITDLADYIMIARGDLGVEMETEEVPLVQKQIIKLCNKKGVPVITATQMLESMIHHPRPTRAEASDVANAVLDGSDALMLSGETASGAFPIKAVRTMNRIVSLIEEKNDSRRGLGQRKPEVVYPPSLAIGYSACDAANLVNASAIVCLTHSGSTAAMISRFRPGSSIIAMTPNITTYFRTSLMWGVSGFLTNEFAENMDEAVCIIIELLKDKKVVSKGDTLVFTAGIPFYKKRGTNMLRIETV